MTKIRIVEVGPRDGLQNEPHSKQLPLEELVRVRTQFVLDLSHSGLIDIEAGAFVRADYVAQMAGTDKVLRGLQTKPEWKKKRFWTLVPNHKGLENAIASDAKHISVFTATSDAFNQKNIHMTVKESLAELIPVINEAKKNKMHVRGYVSTVWGCPYVGKIDKKKALYVTERLLEMGVEEVSLGDTIGVATPKQVSEVLKIFPKKWPLAVHFHDTRGMAIANALCAVEAGITVFDASAGGLGGCPYASGASGNVATEDLIYMLHGMGLKTGIDIDQVCIAVEKLAQSLHIRLPSRYHSAWKAKSKTNLEK